MQDPVKQRLGVYVWTGISVVMLGVLMNLFKIKQGGCELTLVVCVSLGELLLIPTSLFDPLQIHSSCSK